MKRRTLLATVAFPGCLADYSGNLDGDRPDDGDQTDRTTDADDDSVVAHFDGEPVRPEYEKESETIEVDYGDETREYETAETIPYPDPPTEIARDDAVEYVEAFEHAYVTHDVLCDGRGSGHVLSVGYNVRRSETFDWYDDITVVFLLRAGDAVSGIDGGAASGRRTSPTAASFTRSTRAAWPGSTSTNHTSCNATGSSPKRPTRSNAESWLPPSNEGVRPRFQQGQFWARNSERSYRSRFSTTPSLPSA